MRKWMFMIHNLWSANENVWDFKCVKENVGGTYNRLNGPRFATSLDSSTTRPFASRIHQGSWERKSSWFLHKDSRLPSIQGSQGQPDDTPVSISSTSTHSMQGGCLDYIRHYSHKCIGVRRNARNRAFQPLLFRKTYRWGADKYSAAWGRSAQC